MTDVKVKRINLKCEHLGVRQGTDEHGRGEAIDRGVGIGKCISSTLISKDSGKVSESGGALVWPVSM